MVLSFSDDPEAALESDVPEDAISVYFNADCNGFWGDFRITSTALESTGSYMMTEMGCERPLHVQEDWLAKFLMDGPRLSWSGDHLALTGDTATLSLLNKKVADPDRPLVGRQWTSSHYINRGSLSWMSLEAYPTLSFSEEGALSIFDGCNQFEGRFSISGSELVLTQMVPVTEHQCTDEHVLTISAHYEKVFVDGTLTYSIDANVVRIERGENGVEGYTD
jgi:heat shock protein HslJ